MCTDTFGERSSGPVISNEKSLLIISCKKKGSVHLHSDMATLDMQYVRIKPLFQIATDYSMFIFVCFFYSVLMTTSRCNMVFESYMDVI